MGLISTAVALAAEAPVDNPQVPPYLFGLFTFAALGVLLVITMMIKVGR
ncbi:MAG: hypothetical protein F2923_00190 [Actinobacteria bacterium]|uniref:Unannotated protein n=1 Tax=freshwater metagenome TaxID=449393 RepID=A0A6J7RW14_9ZZZZ|nr:hypothetical protein [Actinomycetota bacterium]MTB27042.1 hypothetical protein [Actinomycetota bacterium]